MKINSKLFSVQPQDQPPAKEAREMKVKLNFLPAGASEFIPTYKPWTIDLKEKPAQVTEIKLLEPTTKREQTKTVKSVERTGDFLFGPADHLLRVNVRLDSIVDDQGETTRLYVDGNGNGLFSDDPQPVWTRDVEDPNLTSGKIKVHVGDRDYSLCVYRRLDDPSHLSYYADYALKGTLTVPGKEGIIERDLMIFPYGADGSFAWPLQPWPAELQNLPDDPEAREIAVLSKHLLTILFDYNGDHAFDIAEKADAIDPVVIEGKNYTLKSSTPRGDEVVFQIEDAEKPFEVIFMPKTGEAVRELSGTLITGPQKGREIHLNDQSKDFQGKIVLIDFWGTWCLPCRNALPHLAELRNSLRKEFGDCFEIIGVASREDDHSAAMIEEKLQKFEHDRSSRYDWLHIKDVDDKISTRWGIAAYPTVFVIDGDTHTVLISSADPKDEKVRAEIREAVRQKAKP